MTDTLLDEICGNGALQDYRQEVDCVIAEIRSHNVKVSCQYNIDQSVTEWDQRRIRVGIPRENELKGLRILWGMVHELGHLMTGAPGERPQGAVRLERERAAWDDGWQFVTLHLPQLHELQRDYEAVRDECLATYQRRQ